MLERDVSHLTASLKHQSSDVRFHPSSPFITINDSLKEYNKNSYFPCPPSTIHDSVVAFGFKYQPKEKAGGKNL